MQHKCLVPYLVSGESLQISSQQIRPAFGTYVRTLDAIVEAHSGLWLVLGLVWDLADHQQDKPFHEWQVNQLCACNPWWKKTELPCAFLVKIVLLFLTSLELSHPLLCWAVWRALHRQSSANSWQGFSGGHPPALGITRREARLRSPWSLSPWLISTIALPPQWSLHVYTPGQGMKL